MFVSYRGRGWIVGVCTGCCLLVYDYFTGLHFHDPKYYDQHGWPKLAAFWTAAAITHALLPSRDEVPSGTREIDVQRSVLRDDDRLVGLPVRYWPLALFVLGIVFYFL